MCRKESEGEKRDGGFNVPYKKRISCAGRVQNITECAPATLARVIANRISSVRSPQEARDEVRLHTYLARAQNDTCQF